MSNDYSIMTKSTANILFFLMLRSYGKDCSIGKATAFIVIKRRMNVLKVFFHYRTHFSIKFYRFNLSQAVGAPWDVMEYIM